jgi:XTP/dITP diphosphohydrolase
VRVGRTALADAVLGHSFAANTTAIQPRTLTRLSQLLIATTNPGKLAEFRELLQNRVEEIVSSIQVNAPEVEEDEATLQGNALKKAQTLFEFTGIPSLADDTGLEVDALNGRPGVWSARYAGPDADANANMAKLIHELKGKTDRSAQFRTAVAYYDGNGARLFEGICRGAILEAPRGDQGFGYDPLFLPDGESGTFAELASEVKNRISHRGRALQSFLNDLETW